MMSTRAPGDTAATQSFTVAFEGPLGRSSGVFTAGTAPDGSCHLDLELGGLHLSASGPDFFEALCTIRRELEDGGILPICYGASLGCHPSGMSRDMAQGLAVYKLSPGSPAAEADLVGLFDAGPDVVPATVEQQRAAFERWLGALPREGIAGRKR